MIVEIKGTGQKVQFPDGMNQDEMLAALRRQWPSTAYSNTLNMTTQGSAEPVEQTLEERIKQGVADFLFNQGIISDRYGAQRIGENIAMGAGALPVVGDMLGGDELGRALREGDATGIGFGALAALPVVGDAARALPLAGKRISSITDLFDYTPRQLVEQAKYSDPSNVIDGNYVIDRGRFRTEYYDDGTSAIIKKEDNTLIRKFNEGETSRVLKDRILREELNRVDEKTGLPLSLVEEYRKEVEGGDALFRAKAAKRMAEREGVEFNQREFVEELEQGIERAKALRAQPINDVPLESSDYRMMHKAPTIENGDAPGFNAAIAFGDDIYRSDAVRLYGHGVNYDREAIAVLQRMKDKPLAQVKIYRAVPKSVKTINNGDWVTTTRTYAKDHMEGEDGWHIISKTVPAYKLATDGNSIHEFGYSESAVRPTTIER